MSNKSMQSRISRRDVLKGASAVAGLGALGAFPAFGQTDKKIVLSTWGGDYAKLLTKHVSAVVLTPKGWTVVNDEAQVVQRKAKTVAEKRLPKGTSDVQALTATDIAELTAMDVLEPLDLSQLKNSPNIIKTFSIADSPLFSPHIYSGKVVLYNPKLIKDVPKGMDSLWDPKNQGKVGIVDIQHVYTTMAAALVGGRQDRRLRQGQEGAARAQEAEAAHLSQQRGDRPGAADRGGRAVHHVEGARGAMAERGHQRPDRGAQGRAHQLRVGFRDSEERAEQGRRLRLPRRRAGALRAGRLRRRHGLQPRGPQREGRARISGRASASRRKRRSFSSTRTSTSWPSGWRSSRTSGTRSSSRDLTPSADAR